MENELDTLLIELKSDKKQVRSKAFTRFYQLLTTKLNDILPIIENNEALSWRLFFLAANEGVIQQARSLFKVNKVVNEDQNDIRLYSETISIIAKSSSSDDVGVPSMDIAQSVTDVINNEETVKYFGKTYILLIEQVLLHPKKIVSDLTTFAWKYLVERIFKLMRSTKHNIKFSDLAACNYGLIRIGCQHSYLQSVLMEIKVFTFIQTLLEKRTNDNEHLEIIAISYQCCKNMVVENREEVCKFIESIGDALTKYFRKKTVPEKHREIRFKFMDIILIAHIPNIGYDNQESINLIQNRQKWKRLMNEFEFVIKKELTACDINHRDITSVEVSEVIVQSAVRFCYYYYWNDELRQADSEGEDEQPSNSKRLKLTSKIDIILELIKPSADTLKGFNWKWLAVLVEIIANFKNSLTNEDMSKVLKILSECKSLLEQKSQVVTFTKCCSVLIQNEKLITNPIVQKFHQEQWSKIADEALRLCSGSNKIAVDTHLLLQLLIRNEKYSTQSFIESVLKMYTAEIVPRNDTTLTTLIIILKSYNLDSLTNGKEWAIKILEYAFQKHTVISLKKIFASGNEKPSSSVLAEVAACCCILKKDVINFAKKNQQQVSNDLWKSNKYKIKIENMIKLIRKKSLCTLILEDEDFLTIKKSSTSIETLPSQLECIIDLPLFEELMKLTEFRMKTLDENSTIEAIRDYLSDVFENNEIMMHMASTLIRYKALNEEKLNSCFIAKKMDYHVQEIERLLTYVQRKAQNFDLTDTFNILTSLKSLLGIHYHPAIGLRIRMGNLRHTLHWIVKQQDPEINPDDRRSKNMSFSQEEFLNARNYEKIRYLSITALSQYFFYGDSNNTTEAVAKLNDIDFYIDDIIDLHAMFEVIDMFGNSQDIPTQAIQWIWIAIKSAFKYHKNCLYIMHQLAERVDKIVRFSLEYNDLTTNVILLYRNYSNVCSDKELDKRRYNPTLAVKFLEQFVIFHQHYFKLCYSESEVQVMYTNVVFNFLQSKTFEIQIAAIKCFSAIMQFDIDAEVCPNDVESLNQTRNELYTVFKNELESEEFIKDTSYRIHLFTSLFCANFHLRKPMLFALSKLFCTQNLPEQSAIQCMDKILKFLQCDPSSLLDKNSKLYLMSEWITVGFRINNFPWYFCGNKSLNEFLDQNYYLLLLALLKTNCGYVADYLKSSMDSDSENQPIVEVIDECFAFIAPIKANCANIDCVYQEKVNDLEAQLNEKFSKEEQKNFLIEKLPNVIIKILQNVIDEEKMEEISGYKLEFHQHMETLSMADYEKCISYLQKEFRAPANFNLITFLCMKEMGLVAKLFIQQRSRIQSTELKEHKILYLLQYCILTESTYEYMNAETDEFSCIKQFLIREVVSYMGFLISDLRYGNKLREIAANFVHLYLKQILPSCTEKFRPQMNELMASLVTVANKEDESLALHLKCFQIIHFLVQEQSALSDVVAKIDPFPAGEKFSELRQYQYEIKYGASEFTLVEEIEHFLSVKKRKSEGLIELSRHLASKKGELKSIFAKIQSGDDLLHKLLYKLVEYIQSPSDGDNDGALQAIKCLGEIGSHNLSKIAFTNTDLTIYESIENVQKCQRLICHKLLDEMEWLLLHSNHRVFEAASGACYHMFASSSSLCYPENPLFRPYTIGNASSNVLLFYLEPKIDKTLDLEKFFEDNKTVSYDKWLRSLCVYMMIFAGDKVLNLLAHFQLPIAETLNSLVFQLLTYYEREEINRELLRGLNYFFAQCNEALNYKEKTNEGLIFIDKKAIREILKLTEVIRTFCRKHPKSCLTQMLNVNHLHIARAAKFCEAFFTAIMHCEMWTQKMFEEEGKLPSELITNKTLQDVMFHSHSAIGVKDPIDLYINPFTNRSLYLQNTGQFYQKLLEAENTWQNEELTKVCYEIRFENMFLKFNEKLNNPDKSKAYDCLWRLSDWSDVVETETEIKDQNGLVDYQGEYNKYHYLGLQGLKNGDELGTKGAVKNARNMILQSMSQQSLECTNTLYKFLEMAHRLVQIEDFSTIRFKRLHNSHEVLLKKWTTHNELPIDYEKYESILMQRYSIFDTANIKSGRRTWIPEANKSNSFFAIREAVSNGQPWDAFKIIEKIKTNESVTERDRMALLIEESKLNLQTDLNLARKILLSVIEDPNAMKDFVLMSNAHRLYGEILAENYSASISEINEKHFEKSLNYLRTYAQQNNKSHLVPRLDNDEQLSQFSQKTLEENGAENECEVELNIKNCASIFDTMAKYFDREYINKASYIKSDEFKQKKLLCEKNRKLFEQIKSRGDIRQQDQEVRRSYILLDKSVKLDEAEFAAAEKEKKFAARNALYNYVRSVIQSVENDVLNIFRIISLMLENYDSSTFLQELLTQYLPKIPSHKFIVALPQVTVRLTNSNDDKLSAILNKLLERCAIDHPHHTIPILLAIVNSNADIMDKKQKVEDEPRVMGAKMLWNRLLRNKTIYTIMEQQMKMAMALIDLAYLQLNQNKIPDKHKLLALKNMNFLQCPTVDLPIRKNAKYPTESLTHVMRWEAEISNVGGINAPKKIEVVCSDGVIRSQLLKGKDDMRQDAIMQQIFGVVNQLLMVNKEMSKKQARIRTYKVIPFSRRSGILEWCSNTTPIGSYLSGTKGAHERLRPNDWATNKALREIASVDGKSSEVKEKKFQEICENLKPVFHHFFYEHYDSPGMIFERRFTYTVSVAVSSIIGYILGIGDRHVQNILIDLKTAEVIHIDFGIAFEAGKCLPHPEHIPFRLTRDMIAPMGVSGVDGVFRKTCEKTIQILRENEKTLTTILEVMLYDPMYSWSVGVKYARRNQLESDDTTEDDEEEENQHDSMASRALSRVKSKLKGFADDSAVLYPSIDGQVQFLIQTATNHSILSRLFRGWQAYL